MTKAEFARRMNVSRAAVTQWDAAGRLVLTEDGEVDAQASEARLRSTINARGGKRKAGVAGGAPAAEQLQSGELELTGGTLSEEQRNQARGRARLLDLDYKERVGELVEKARIELAIADGMAPILSQIRTISIRCGPKVVGQTDLRHVQDAIDDEVEKICQDTADTLRAILGGGARQ